MTRLGLLVTTALAACLAAMLATAYQAPGPEDVTLPRPLPLAASAAPPAPAPDPVQPQVDRILARPLFNPDRRPLAAPAAPGGAPASLPRLSAILVSAAGRTVIFAAATGGRPVTLAEGGHIAGYVVQRIGANQVVLAGPAGTLTLRPAFDTEAADGPATPPAAASPLDQLRLRGTALPFAPIAPTPR